MKRLTTFFLIFLFAFAGFGQTTYYIDEGGNNGDGGGIGDPWLTLDYACTQVTTPGDIIHVNAGTYNEPNRCELSPGINIEGEGITSIIVSTYAAGTTDDASIYLNSIAEGTTGNQSISYIKLDGSSLTGHQGIYVGRRSNVIIHHCTIIDFHYGAVNFDGTIIPYGVVVYSTGNQLYNCIITNCSTRNAPGKEGHIILAGQTTMVIHDNTFTQDSRAPGENGNIIDGVDGELINIKIYDNIFTKAVDAGGEWDFHIEVWDVYGGMEIYDNEFYEGYQCIDNGGYGNIKGSYDYAIWIHDNYFELAIPLASQGARLKMAVDIEGNNDGIIVNNNHIKNFPFGVYIAIPAYVAAPKLITDINVYCNIFENIGYSAGSDFSTAIYFVSEQVDGTIENVYISNNTITGGYFTYTGIYIYESCDITNIYLRNNIIQDSYFGPIEVDGGGGGTLDVLYVQNNLYYSNGNSDNISYPNSGSAENLTEENNLKGNPDFKSSIDFHLRSNSPAIKAGIDVGLSKDYDGRNISDPPDIGAYQFGWRIVTYDGKVIRAYDTQQPLNVDESADLAAWYEGKHSSSFILDGTSVDRWKDLSGNGYHCNNTNDNATRPTWDSSTGRVTFTSANSTFLQSAAFASALTQPNTIFVVYKLSNNDIYYSIVSDGTFGNSNSFAGWAYYFVMRGGINLSSGLLDDTDDRVHCGLFNGVNSNYWIDGVLKASGDAGSESLGGIHLGSRYDGWGDSDCQISEIIVFNADISDVSRDKLTGYLSNKWGITATTDFKGYIIRQD